MKVSCPSCEAKYNIADDKIKGKKVKVRCKSCGTQILVDGNSSQVSSLPPPDDANNDAEISQSSSPAALDDSVRSDAWTVNFSDSDERTLTTAEIAEMAAQGQLGDEVFVWKDGMGDWQLVTSIPELASAIAAAKRRTTGTGKAGQSQKTTGAEPTASASSQPPPVATSGATVGPIVAAPGSALAKKIASAKSAAAQKKAAGAEAPNADVAGEAGTHDATAGADAATTKKPTTEPPPAHKSGPEHSLAPKAATKLAAKRQTGTHDLFAAVDRAGSEIDVDTSDADAREPVKATGARNENSVLFSLDALKSGMLGGPAATSSTQPSVGPRKKPPGAPTKRLEDLMTVDAPAPTFGGGSFGGGGLLLSGNDALLAAPPPPPPKPEPKPEPVRVSGLDVPVAAPRKNRLGLVIVLAVGLVAVGAGGAFVALKSTADKEAKPEGSVATTTSSVAAASAPASAAASVAPVASSAPTAVAKNEADAGVPSTASSAVTQTVAAANKGGATRPVTGGKATPAEAKPDKKPDTKPAEPASGGGSGGFNKDAAVAALSVAASQATVCKRPEGPWGSGRAVVTFAPSGRVTTANVTGDPFGGTAVGGCVASVFRRAKIPGFSGDPVTVSKSFTIAP